MTKRYFIVTMISILLLATSPAFAGAPLLTDDADTVGKGSIEIELNGAYGYDRSKGTRTDVVSNGVKIATGLSDRMSFSLATPYIINERTNTDGQITESSGFGDSTLDIKYIFAKQDGTAYAFKPSIIIPTGSESGDLTEGRWQFGGTLIASQELSGGNYFLHANLGYEHHNFSSAAQEKAKRSNQWFGSVAGEAKSSKNLIMVADFGLATNPDRGSHTPPVYFLVGARYEIFNYLDVNSGIKLGITNPENTFDFLYGLTLKF